MVAVSPLLLSALEVIAFQRRTDDDSFSSTVWCMDDETGKASAASSPIRQGRRRRSSGKDCPRVRFNDAANTVHADRPSESCDDDNEDEAQMDVVDDELSQSQSQQHPETATTTTTWYSTAEYLHLRQSAVASAQQIVAIESRNRAPRSYMKVMERCYDRCLHMQLDEYERNDRIHVVRWVQTASSRIGLEKWSIKRMSIERSRRRLGIVIAVLNSNTEEARRIASLQWSQPAVVFARVWADAIAVAVSNENGDLAESSLWSS
jgi:hypothetical protein